MSHEELISMRDGLSQQLMKINHVLENKYKDLSNRRPGRPKGSKSQNSLDSYILRALSESPEGLSFSNILLKIYEQGYKTKSCDSVFRNMLKSRLSCLKTQGYITKDEKMLVFFLVSEK